MTIILDLDGVLADFVSAACTVHGVDPLSIKWNGNDALSQHLGLSQGEFWKKIDNYSYDFWHELEPYPWFEELIDYVERFDPHFHIATSPPHNRMAAAGKVGWMQQHLGVGFRRYFITPQKQYLARYDRILIDDRDKEIERWVFEADNDHSAITFPQPWNRCAASVEKRMEHVRDGLAEFYGSY